MIKDIKLLSLNAERDSTTSSQRKTSTEEVDENREMEKTPVPEGHQGVSSVVSSTRHSQPWPVLPSTSGDPPQDLPPELGRDTLEIIMDVCFPLSDLFLDICQLVLACLKLCRPQINGAALTPDRKYLIIIAIIGSVILFLLILLISISLIVASALLELDLLAKFIIHMMLFGCNILWFVFVFVIGEYYKELKSC